MNRTLWKCEQLRAGQVTNRLIFSSEQRASEFVARMQMVEPDLSWRVEAVEAGRVWN